MKNKEKIENAFNYWANKIAKKFHLDFSYPAFLGGYDAGWDAAKAEKPEPCIPDKPGWYWMSYSRKPAEAVLICYIKNISPPELPGETLCVKRIDISGGMNLDYYLRFAKFWPANPPWEGKE